MAFNCSKKKKCKGKCKCNCNKGFFADIQKAVKKKFRKKTYFEQLVSDIKRQRKKSRKLTRKFIALPVKKKELSSQSQKPQKYKRGRRIILEHPDGTISEWQSPQAIQEAVGIPQGAIRKNISGNSGYIRFNHQKYQASYKEAC